MARRNYQTSEGGAKEKKDRYIDSETVVMYGSWYKALKKETVEYRCAIYEMIINYGCFGIEPDPEELDVSRRPLWEILKDVIDEDKAKRKKRVLQTRAAMEKYRAKKRGKSKSDDLNDLNDFPTLNSESEIESEGEFGSGCESEGEPELSTFTNKSLKTSSSSKDNNDVSPKDGGGDDGGIENPIYNKEMILRICLAKGMDEAWFDSVYSEFEAQNFTIGKKPISNMVKLIESKWVKEKAKRDLVHEDERKAKEQEEQKNRVKERKAKIAEYRPPKEHVELWNVFMDTIKKNLNKDRFEFWRVGINFYSFDNQKNVNIVLPSKFYLDEFKKNYEQELLPYIKDTFGSERVKFAVDGDLFAAISSRNST